MRRIDVLTLGLGVFIAGGLIYAVLRVVGLDSLNAGIWSQVIFAVGLLGWLLSYVLRVFTGNMTYNQQLDEYEADVLQKRLEELSPEDLAALQTELDQEHAGD